MTERYLVRVSSAPSDSFVYPRRTTTRSEFSRKPGPHILRIEFSEYECVAVRPLLRTRGQESVRTMTVDGEGIAHQVAALGPRDRDRGDQFVATGWYGVADPGDTARNSDQWRNGRFLAGRKVDWVAHRRDATVEAADGLPGRGFHEPPHRSAPEQVDPFVSSVPNPYLV